MDNTSDNIRVLIADDDEHILQCYRLAFCESEITRFDQTLGSLEAELFDTPDAAGSAVKFEVVACSQGRDAVLLVAAAADEGKPFDVVILDVRMPPGIDGVEAASKIREFDHEVEIVFVTGFADIGMADLEQRVPPPLKLHYFNKPLSFMQLAEDVACMVRAG